MAYGARDTIGWIVHAQPRRSTSQLLIRSGSIRVCIQQSGRRCAGTRQRELVRGAGVACSRPGACDDHAVTAARDLVAAVRPARTRRQYEFRFRRALTNGEEVAL